VTRHGDALVLTEVDAGIGIVTLNRPHAHNLLDAALAESLIGAFNDLVAQPGLRTIVLSALGDSFSVGSDPLELERSGLIAVEPALAARLLRSVAECVRPVVARVQGPAYGLGAGLNAACDIAIASFDAEFSFDAVHIGRVPAVIAPYVIAAVGPPSANTLATLLTDE
jgi:methylglutaconyl-CoA hydratase